MQRLTQEEPWAKIPHWVVMHPDLDASAIRVYAVLSKHANKARHSFPGLIKLAEEARMSKTTVIKALSQLESAGAVIIKRERMANNRHRVNLYHLPLNRVSPESVLPDIPITALPGTEIGLPSGAETEQELDLKNQLTRELESSKPIPRLPGESHKDYMLRVASLIPGLDS